MSSSACSASAPLERLCDRALFEVLGQHAAPTLLRFTNACTGCYLAIAASWFRSTARSRALRARAAAVPRGPGFTQEPLLATVFIACGAWPRLTEAAQVDMRQLLDQFLAPRSEASEAKSVKPQAIDELQELASGSNASGRARSELARYVLNAPGRARSRLWPQSAASARRTVTPERITSLAAAPTAARSLLRGSGRRCERTRAACCSRGSRVIAPRRSQSVRGEVQKRLERASARADFIRAVTEYVPVEDAELLESFGEELPVGLRLLDPG